MTVNEAIEALSQLNLLMERGMICPHQDELRFVGQFILSGLKKPQADKSVLKDAEEHIAQIKRLVEGKDTSDETQRPMAA